MISGCYTALITPFNKESVDYNGLKSLVDFQIKNGITGILAVGTTGESPTLLWEEHNRIIKEIAAKTKNNCPCIAGTGSNNTKESINATRHAAQAGVDAVLLVDPYYNGPSSLEIRREYIEPVAKIFPEIEIIPYIIPGRTGAQLLPEDLAILNSTFENINTVKEATGNIDNMKQTRKCCGPDFTIMSGDDSMTLQMITDAEIKASGVISVLSNIIPGHVTKIVELLADKEVEKAGEILSAVEPLYELVTVTTKEITKHGEVTCRARNPLAVKTLMSILGMPSGGCRRPLGKMTKNGIKQVLETVRKVQKKNPEVFKPVEDFFEVDVKARLNDPENWKDLHYDKY
ncbi:MAG TPA: 4-hydroxy-tetrahydrodipicolinate synthase [Desulfobacteraceae bacterium]|nr:4-hydroxy-tetrahydrodipicolinate synthase [Desulfobacteraceae bacterium]